MIKRNRRDTNSRTINSGNKKWLKILGISLVAFSFLLYFAIALVPFTIFPVHIKGLIFLTIVIIKDVSLGLGVIILGKEFLVKYLKYISILDWFKKRKHR